jgi:hypothetical protein
LPKQVHPCPCVNQSRGGAAIGVVFTHYGLE